VAGRDYDSRVQVPLELSEDELFRLMTMAHERDITLNQLVTDVIQRVIDREELRILEEEVAELDIVPQKKSKRKAKKS
jgi:DNA-binding PucR family transcriptional regulator